MYPSLLSLKTERSSPLGLAKREFGRGGSQFYSLTPQLVTPLHGLHHLRRLTPVLLAELLHYTPNWFPSNVFEWVCERINFYIMR